MHFLMQRALLSRSIFILQARGSMHGLHFAMTNFVKSMVLSKVSNLSLCHKDERVNRRMLCLLISACCPIRLLNT